MKRNNLIIGISICSCIIIFAQFVLLGGILKEESHSDLLFILGIEIIAIIIVLILWKTLMNMKD